MGTVEGALSRKLGRKVSPGEIVALRVDALYAHDGTAPLVMDVLESELGWKGPLEAADRTYFFIDHSAPAPHVAAATVHKRMREFARRHGIKLYDVGRGISHQVVYEEGIARPGALILGADSHTPTVGATGAIAIGVGSTDLALAMAYGETWLQVPEPFLVKLEGRLRPWAMGKDVALRLIGELGTDGLLGKYAEFRGKGLGSISMDSRLTISNMTAEMGAVTAVFEVDDLAAAALGLEGPLHFGDDSFVDGVELELDAVEPMVSLPGDVGRVAEVSEAEGTEVDVVFIGSCTNGRLEDVAMAAKILSGRRARARCIVSPASSRVYMDSLAAGYIEALLKSGCVVAPPTCGPCVGAHMGVLAEGEVAVSTTNRNFPGRMGHVSSKVFLASPATAAASAVAGRVADPRKYLGGGS
ncbi:MAG: 3-isopropylmalate dehydratase/homoaconitate hydratase family large subunit [Desulfurococcaceae archaeon]